MLAFEVGTKAKDHDLQENFTRMRIQGDSPVITAIGRFVLFLNYLNDRILPKLWHCSLLPDP